MKDLSSYNCITKPDEVLIELYLFIEQAHEQFLYLSCQRFSNNDVPDFTDVELLTTYLFGQINGLHTQKKLIAISKTITRNGFPSFPVIPVGISVCALFGKHFPLWQSILQSICALGKLVLQAMICWIACR